MHHILLDLWEIIKQYAKYMKKQWQCFTFVVICKATYNMNKHANKNALRKKKRKETYLIKS